MACRMSRERVQVLVKDGTFKKKTTTPTAPQNPSNEVQGEKGTWIGSILIETHTNAWNR